MFPVNCYVLWDDTKEAVVIDPGCFYEEEKQALKKFILTNELNVKHLLNTHLHLDHIFGNPFMLKEFGLSAEANKADEYWIDEAPKQSRMFGFQLQEEPVPLGKYLHDGDIITFGHTKLEAIHVPGHSPGSLVYSRIRLLALTLMVVTASRWLYLLLRLRLTASHWQR